MHMCMRESARARERDTEEMFLLHALKQQSGDHGRSGRRGNSRVGACGRDAWQLAPGYPWARSWRCVYLCMCVDVYLCAYVYLCVRACTVRVFLTCSVPLCGCLHVSSYGSLHVSGAPQARRVPVRRAAGQLQGGRVRVVGRLAAGARVPLGLEVCA